MQRGHKESRRAASAELAAPCVWHSWTMVKTAAVLVSTWAGSMGFSSLAHADGFRCPGSGRLDSKNAATHPHSVRPQSALVNRVGLAYDW